MTITSHQYALPPGTALLEYRLTGLLGAGAFGITYLARDTLLDKDVAIKEYLPSAFAARAADGTVVAITQQQEHDYRWGLERFSQEARTLARFSHPHIVRVNRYFEGNGTGYMVMDYERGESLKGFILDHPLPSEEELKALVWPLLDGLERVHAAGFLHRDIKPDNIFLREDGGPVLIDFGSARQTAGDSGQALTTIVSPGYAPFEQYTTSKKQGPWSDIYSLGGVMFFLMTGHNPPDAITRMKGDTLAEQLAEVRERYSPALIHAVVWALALEEKARPADIAAWRGALLGTNGCSEVSLPTAGGPDVGVRALADAVIADSTMLILDAVGEEPATLKDAAARALGSWDWLLGHLLLVAVSALLGSALGALPAFQEAQLAGGRFSAAMLAQALGASGAVVFLWMLGRGIALRFRAHGGPRAVLHELMMPLVTLLALAIAYAVLQRPLAPALDETLRAIYAWGFLLGTCACAIWLSMAVFIHTEPLRKLLHQYRRGGTRTGNQGGSA